jgi:hypothetical protein
MKTLRRHLQGWTAAAVQRLPDSAKHQIRLYLMHVAFAPTLDRLQAEEYNPGDCPPCQGAGFLDCPWCRGSGWKSGKAPGV